jgi:hypothetical protein
MICTVLEIYFEKSSKIQHLKIQALYHIGQSLFYHLEILYVHYDIPVLSIPSYVTLLKRMT